MGVTIIPVRATISIGGMSVSTPFVLSFTVRKARGQISTFDASLKVAHNEISGLTGGEVSIKAGTKSGQKQVFTGIVRNARMTPCWDDPNYVLLTISGNDVLSLLQGKKYTRRCRASRGQFCVITSARQGLKSGKFTYDSENVFEIDEVVQEKQLPSTGTITPGVEAIKVGKVSAETKTNVAHIYVTQESSGTGD
jgi:hypothetical protein